MPISDTKNKSKSDETPPTLLSSSSYSNRLLIIGAGYAGLSLAQFLRTAADNNNDKKKQWDVTVVDRLHPPSATGCKIHGTIRVPLAVTALLPRLLLLRSVATSTADKTQAQRIQTLLSRQQTTKDFRLAENELLTVLRHGLDVQYRHVAGDIVCIPDNRHVTNPNATTNRMYVKIFQGRHAKQQQNSCRSTTTELWGPYDGIVAADGALSRYRRGGVPRAAVGRVWLLGDAQSQRNQGWDFGHQRLQRGADMAIQHALWMADALLMARTTCLDANDSNESTKQVQQQLQHHLVKLQAKPERTLGQRLLSWMALVLVLVLGILLMARNVTQTTNTGRH